MSPRWAEIYAKHPVADRFLLVQKTIKMQIFKVAKGENGRSISKKVKMFTFLMILVCKD